MPWDKFTTHPVTIEYLESDGSGLMSLKSFILPQTGTTANIWRQRRKFKVSPARLATSWLTLDFGQELKNPRTRNPEKRPYQRRRVRQMSQAATRMDFLSREELLRYRTLTQILSLTNDLPIAYPSSLGLIRGRKGTLSFDAFPYLFAFTQLVTYKNQVATTIFNLGDRTKSPRVVVVGNASASATASQTASRDTHQSQLVCRKTQLTGTLFPAGTEAAAQYYVDLIDKTTEDGKLQSRITFSAHANNLVGMLRQTRIARTDDELDIAGENLLDYLAIMRCEKIHDRLFQSSPIYYVKETDTTRATEEAAKHTLTRKFYDVLTQDVSNCEWAYKRRSFPPVKPLTWHQNQVYRCVVEFLQQHHRDHMLDRLPRPDELWYNATGRVIFHHIITRLLEGLARAVEELLMQKRECHRRKTDILLGVGSREPDVARLQEAAERLSDWAHHLSELRLGFSKILPHHFKWLERELRRSDSDLLNEENATLDAESSSSDDTVEDFSGALEAEERLDTGNPEYSPDFAKLAELSHDDWANGAVNYLRFVLRDISAHAELDRLEICKEPNWREYMSNIMRKGEFHLIEVIPEYDDHRMMSIRKLLMEELGFAGEEDPEHPDPLGEILEWINSENKSKNVTVGEYDFDSTYFSGGYHCESTMLCLQLLARERDNLSPASINSGIVLPDKEVTDLFQDDIVIMPSSRLCCPSCMHLVQYFYYHHRRRNQAIWGSVVHKDWVPCSLPPWIPRKAGEWMLAQASNSLKQRLEGIIAAIEASRPDDTATAL
ncbi:hypothetical protein CFIO01_03316 [Colletotrichum fioriniae PJ7]|uniref:Uncharacterized protein n=1 Tax=Colletotrichum fioriniae PJ7 TaxID=1445577 RepID=A0A010RL47_9PEZI|nr:hypothetical protein CFIO01_03316 [Colletotrichum fioriniae PJ7]